MYIDRELTILKTYQITTGLGLEMMALGYFILRS